MFRYFSQIIISHILRKSYTCLTLIVLHLNICLVYSYTRPQLSAKIYNLMGGGSHDSLDNRRRKMHTPQSLRGQQRGGQRGERQGRF